MFKAVILASCLTLTLGATKAEIASAARSISDLMKQVQVTQSGKQSGLDKFIVSSIANLEKLDNEEKELVHTVVDIMDEVLDLFNDTNIAQQGTLDDIIPGDCGPCRDPLHVATDQEFRDTIPTARENHTNCRDEEDQMLTDAAQACLVMLTWMESGSGAPHCVKPHTSPYDTEEVILDDWSDYFSNGYTWFNSSLDHWISIRDPCLDLTADAGRKTIICNTEQNEFEIDFCQWREHQHFMCFEQEKCYDDVESDYQTKRDELDPHSTQRVAEARLVSFIKCLLQNLENDIANETECDTVKDADYSHYGLVYDGTCDREDCSTAETDVHPGHASWYTQEYTVHGWVHATADTVPADDCTIVTPR